MKSGSAHIYLFQHHFIIIMSECQNFDDQPQKVITGKLNILLNMIIKIFNSDRKWTMETIEMYSYNTPKSIVKNFSILFSKNLENYYLVASMTKIISGRLIYICYIQRLITNNEFFRSLVERKNLNLTLTVLV